MWRQMGYALAVIAGMAYEEVCDDGKELVLGRGSVLSVFFVWVANILLSIIISLSFLSVLKKEEMAEEWPMRVIHDLDVWLMNTL